MVAKLAVLIISVALVAGALLAVRQQRIMAAHEMIRAHARIVERERDLWRLRVDIAQHLSPGRIEQIASSLGPMRPAPPEGYNAPKFAGVPGAGSVAGVPVGAGGGR